MEIEVNKRVLEVIVDDVQMPVGEQVEGGDYDIETVYLSNGNQKLKIYDADNLHREDLAFIKGADAQDVLLNGGKMLTDEEYDEELKECYKLINKLIGEE